MHACMHVPIDEPPFANFMHKVCGRLRSFPCAKGPRAMRVTRTAMTLEESVRQIKDDVGEREQRTEQVQSEGDWGSGLKSSGDAHHWQADSARVQHDRVEKRRDVKGRDLRQPGKQYKQPNERHTLREADHPKGMLLTLAIEDGGEARLSTQQVEIVLRQQLGALETFQGTWREPHHLGIAHFGGETRRKAARFTRSKAASDEVWDHSGRSEPGCEVQAVEHKHPHRVNDRQSCRISQEHQSQKQGWGWSE